MITALAIMLAIAGYLQFAGNSNEQDYMAEGQQTDTAGEITDRYQAVGGRDVVVTNDIYEINEVTGLLELTDPAYDDSWTEIGDLSDDDYTDIVSLDEELDTIVENYLDSDMDIMENPDNVYAKATPEPGEIPGDAVFSSTANVAILSEAKLMKEQTRARNKETLMEIIESTGLNDIQKQDAVNSMVLMTEVAEKEVAAEILLEAKGFADAVVSINGGTVDVVVNALSLTDAQRAQIEDIVKRKTEIGAENIIISTMVQD